MRTYFEYVVFIGALISAMQARASEVPSLATLAASSVATNLHAYAAGQERNYWDGILSDKLHLDIYARIRQQFRPQYAKYNLVNRCLQPVNAVKCALNNGFIAAGGRDGKILLWDTNSDKERVILAHPHSIYDIALSADSDSLVSAGLDTEVCWWDVSSGELKRRFTGHAGFVNVVRISSDKRFIVSGADDRTVCIWNTENGASKYLLPHEKGVAALALAPNDQFIVSCARDNVLRVWDVETGQLLPIQAEKVCVLTPAISADSQLIVAGFLDNTLCAWNARSGELIRTFGPIGGVISGFAISPDNRFIAASSRADKAVYVWNANTGALTYKLSRAEIEAYGAITFSADGQFVISGDKHVCVWDLHRGTLKHALEMNATRIDSVVISPDNEMIVAHDGGEGQTCRWKLQTYEDALSNV